MDNIPNITSDKLLDKKRPYHRNPTPRQIKAYQYMSDGMTKRQALIKAGYALSVANHKSAIVERSKAAQQINEALKIKLLAKGVDIDFMADKIVRWMNAKKKDKEDYKTQQAAYKIWKDVVEPEKDNEEGRGLKRKITYEEFLGEDKQDNQDEIKL